MRTFSAGALAPESLRRMADLLHHRGPDQAGVWVGQDVGLTHTSLTVPDDQHSRQPMHSPDGRWVLVLDGRIVNHESLRAHLDHPFRTSGEAEVVAVGLALEGVSFVERLQGQFALVAHDLRTDTTHLVRDRLGIRPLHYRHVPGGIAFASEAKGLLAVGPPLRVDHRSLDAYLGSHGVPAPDTMFEGVKKVRPAHRLSVMPRGHVEEVPYWAPPECDPVGTWTPGDAVEAVGDGVREAVRAALGVDALVGVHLSGDLDSSLVVAHVQQLRGDQGVHTFSAGFDDRPQDELTWAHRASDLLGTRHHEVRLQAADFEDLWARLTWHRDAPIAEPADVVAYGLAREAHEHVRVALSGEGGNELFAGYPKHRYARLTERSALPARLRSTLAGPVDRRLGARQAFTAPQRQRLLGEAPPPERRTSPVPGVDPVDRMLRGDLRHWLPDHLLERGDRMSMAASLELRPALLDHRLVELAFRLPSSVKVRSGTTKWVLKEAARPLLPDELINRRWHHVRVPLDSWFRSGLRDTARERLTGRDSWVGQTLDQSAVHELVDPHEGGDSQELRLWTLLCLEMWHDCFFTPPPPVPSPRTGSWTDLAVPTRPTGS